MSLGSQDIAEARAIRAERQRLISEGQDMSYAVAKVYLTDEWGMPWRQAEALLQLAEVLGQYPSYIESIRSPLVLVCDYAHDRITPDLDTGRYHVTP